MSDELSPQHFRGVLCRHCGKPVRIPSSVLRKDSENLISRVFVLRCRSCERESIYAIDQIVDCTFAQAPGQGSLRHAVA